MNGDSIYLRETEKGKAVFAKRGFIPGELIFKFEGAIFTREEYINLCNPENNHFVQIGEGIFLGPSGKADDLINHSCDPNCGMKITGEEAFLFAIKTIEEDEELTFDYSTTMDENHWEMECFCGKENCRKRVRDFRHLPEEIQRRYISLGIVPSYIADRYIALANETVPL